MAIRLKLVTPAEIRDAAVKFFLRMRAWPWATEGDYFRYWDWRYSSVSESPAAVWVAIDGDEIVGHVAVNFRTLQLDGHDVRAGVPGNFLVDERHRKQMIGPLLARVPKQMVQRGEIDLFLGYSNSIAHSMSRAFGFKDLGPMASYVDVRKWAPVLSRRLPGGALFAPVADIAARLRRSVLGGRSRDNLNGLVVRELSTSEIGALDRSRWRRSAGLIWNGSGAYLAERFLGSPFRKYDILGILNESTGWLEGFIVAEGTTRVNIVLCETNEDVLSVVDAVELLARVTQQAEVIVVPLLPRTELAIEFARAGFLVRSGEDADAVVQRTFWSAYWRPEHPLASSLSQTERWKLWYGWNQH